ncbi:type VI secretion system Vgr family protein [Shewanella surugensis]|uniref:Type VI secretion system tip protein VgrG n=1 Tax=Shewanella surugensis TaxID=212020 RepID=A0ABT0L5L9_9GAMM|nr:type VI secretion system tip protein VgrG [Shewanella surugensis]MCL1122974.1 type VI secretion system tip protein VgrG [Shewanella surugensis]
MATSSSETVASGMLTGSGLRYQFSAEGLEADSFELTEFTFDEGLSTPFEVKISLLSRQSDLNPSDVVDLSGLLQWAVNGEIKRQVHGIVSEFTKGDTGHHHTQYCVTLVPALSRLKLRHNSRIFQQQGSLSIISILLNEMGITDFAFNCDPAIDERLREYCVQYRETDFDFIARLAAEEGLVYHFEHTETSHTLVFSDTTLKLSYLQSYVPYNALSGGAAGQPFVRQFTLTHQVKPSSVSLKDASFKNPAYSFLLESLAKDLQHQADTYEHFDFPGRYKDDEAGQVFTQTRLDYLRRDAIEATGLGNIMAMQAGYKFPLTGHSDDNINRDWLLVQLIHKGVQGAASEEANSTTPTTYDNRFRVIPADSAWQATPTAKPLVNGVQKAVVVGPEGEEIYCDEFGRVKLQFPWDRYSNGDDLSSCWVRVSQGWAGSQYGMMSVPRIGHEVIVSFIEGDPDQPIITGRVHNAVNLPPYPLPEHQSRMVLKTQTHKGEGSNELYFDDEVGEEEIYLHAQKDMNTLVENDHLQDIKHDQHNHIEGERFTQISANEHVNIDGESRTLVKKDHHLHVSGSLHVKAGKIWVDEASSEIHIKAGQKVVIEAASGITVKAGGSFVKVDSGGVHLSGGAINLNAGGGKGSGSGASPKKPALPDNIEDAINPEASDLAIQAATLESAIGAANFDYTAVELAANEAPAAVVVTPALKHKVIIDQREDEAITQVCQKQADGSCPLTDCPCR